MFHPLIHLLFVAVIAGVSADFNGDQTKKGGRNAEAYIPWHSCPEKEEGTWVK